MPVTQQNREVEITTPLGADELMLRDMTCTEELGRLFTIDLELVSEKDTLKFEDLLGEKVSIRLDLNSDSKRYFHGHITRFSQSSYEGGFAVYQATVRPWLWFLTRTSDCRIFQQQTVPDIIKSVFRDLGYTDFEDKLSGTYREWNYCVQYRETDFNLVSRLMEQEGIYYYFKHEKEKHTLVLADGYSAHEPYPDLETIPYYPPDDSTVRDEEHISSWYISKQVQPGAYALNEFDFERPKANLKVDSAVARSHSRDDYEIYDYPGEYTQLGDGDNYAKVRIQEVQSQYEQMQAQSDSRGICVGSLFTLSEYPREDQNREYLVTSATHHIHSDDFGSSGGGGGAKYSNTFASIESTTPYRTARSTPKPMVQGPQTAIIVGPGGEEIHTDKHGRVKLQFHWDRYGKSDGNSSCWVRVAQVWAGKNWGAMYIPRIGQEVIVEFLEGDPDRPIVTGRVYNGDQPPPYDLPADKTKSGIKSRSSKGGGSVNFNEIHFEDKKGDELIYIHAEKNQTNIVENDIDIDIGNDMTLVVGNDRTKTIKNNQTTKVGGDKKEEVVGDVDVDVKGSSKTKVSGDSDEWIISNKSTKTVGHTKSVFVGTSMSLFIGARTINSLGVKHSSTVGSSFDTNLSASIGATKGAKLTIAEATSVHKSKLEKFVAENIHSVEAPLISMEGEDKILMKVGGAAVSIVDGKVEIVGDVKIKGNLGVTGEIKGDTAVKGKNFSSAG